MSLARLLDGMRLGQVRVRLRHARELVEMAAQDVQVVLGEILHVDHRLLAPCRAAGCVRHRRNVPRAYWRVGTDTGSENAMTVSATVVENRPPPPAAMTMNSRPDRAPR